MFGIIITIIIICAILLIVVVLAQNPKGGGLSDQFGGSSSSQIMGVKRTGDLLEKLTWGLIGAIFVLSILSKTAFNTEEEGEGGPQINTTTQQPAPTQPKPTTPIQP